MNRYSTAIVLTGLLIILTNNLAIAKDTEKNIYSICTEINKQASSEINKIKKEDKSRNPNNRNNSLPNAEASPDNAQASFWWAAEQFDPFNGKLVENWLSYPEKQQLNLVVSWRLWTLLDYLGRYRFVNQFGTVARKYGYSLAIFNQKSQCLASYQYNPYSKPPKWELTLEKLGRDSLPIEPQQLEENLLLDNGIQ